MQSLRRRLSQRWQRTENEVRVADSSITTGYDEESSLANQATALLIPQAESRRVEEYGSEELHFIVDYVGSAQISEAKSITRMMETLKRIKKLQVRSIRVNFTIRDGILLVSSCESNSLILTAPLYAIALCAQEQLRGFDSCFGLNITRKKTHMCHVFEAGSKLEVRKRRQYSSCLHHRLRVLCFDFPLGQVFVCDVLIFWYVFKPLLREEPL